MKQKEGDEVESVEESDDLDHDDIFDGLVSTED